jgi:hypothetical protein
MNSFTGFKQKTSLGDILLSQGKPLLGQGEPTTHKTAAGVAHRIQLAC